MKKFLIGFAAGLLLVAVGRTPAEHIGWFNAGG